MNLLDRVKTGDRDALDEFLRVHRVRLGDYARAKMGPELGTRIRTSDLLQSTYLDVLQSLPGFRGSTEEELTGWIVRILENNIHDARKYYGARKRTLDESRREIPIHEEVPGQTPTPSSEVAFFDEVLLVSKAIGRLPEAYQRVILRRLRPETGHRESAEEIERSAGASRVLLHRARAALVIEIDRIRSERSSG